MTLAEWHDEDVDDDLAKTAAAIADPLRVRILDLLAGGRGNGCCSPANPGVPEGVCACDLAPALGGVAPSKLAYHLAHLRTAGLVNEQRRGKWVYYSVNEAALAALADAIVERWSSPGSGRRQATLRCGKARA